MDQVLRLLLLHLSAPPTQGSHGKYLKAVVWEAGGLAFGARMTLEGSRHGSQASGVASGVALLVWKPKRTLEASWSDAVEEAVSKVDRHF